MMIEILKKDYQELVEKEAYYHTSFDLLADLVWLKDIDGVFLRCNDKVLQLVGLERFQIIGKTDYDLFEKDRADYFPSPAVFVYTLPNIMVGEICIKYKIKGESVFFVNNQFNKKMLLEYSQDMIETGAAKICLMGWVDYTETDYHAVLYLVK